MKNKFIKRTALIAILFTGLVSCSSESETEVDLIDDVTDGDTVVVELSSAFDQFSDAVTFTLSDDGTEVYVESTGLPNHTSIYWETDNALYLDETAAGVSKNNSEYFYWWRSR